MGSSRRRSGIARSRAGDPQLHTHVLVANLVQADDGRWSTLDGRRLYAHAKTAGYLYEARLRAELTRELGVEWTPVRNGIADVAGVPRQVLRAFSRRRAQIEAELGSPGQSGARAAQAATLETRRRKDHDVDPVALDRQWRERAAELGFTRADARELFGRAAPTLDATVLSRVACPARRPGRTHASALVVHAPRRGAGLVRAAACGRARRRRVLERLADHFLASDAVVPLAVGQPARVRDEVLQRHDGRMVRALPDERRYSTYALLRQEERLVRRALQDRELGLGLAAPEAVERAIAARPTLSGEQEEMVRRLARDGDGVAVVVGSAGAGKTFALAAAREAWELSGTPVVGAAIAWRAARGLEEEAGIPTTSVAALLARLERDRLPRRCVLVVDEAAMVGTRQMVELADAVHRVRGKLVLVGDHEQVPEIEAGGAFRGLLDRLPAIELRENRRQVEPWERDALALLRDGRGREALDEYEAHGRLRAGDDVRAHEQLVADWWSAGAPERSIMLAYRRVDVAELNGRARELMLARPRSCQARSCS